MGESPTRENDAPICLRTFSMCDVGDYCKKLYWRLRREYPETRIQVVWSLFLRSWDARSALMIAVSRRYRGASITCRDGGSCMSISKQHKMRLCAPRSIFQSSRRRPLLSIGCFTFEQR